MVQRERIVEGGPVQQAQAFWVTSPGRGGIRPVTLPAPEVDGRSGLRCWRGRARSCWWSSGGVPPAVAAVMNRRLPRRAIPAIAGALAAFVINVVIL